MAAILGGKYKLYTADTAYLTLEAAWHGFTRDAEFSEEFDLMIPQITGPTVPSSGFMYEGIVFNDTLASQFNAFAEEWKNTTVFFWVEESSTESYDGEVPLSAMAMFPYRRRIRNGESYFITNDDSNVVFCFSGVGDHCNRFAFVKSTGAALYDVIVPYIEFINVAYDCKTVRNDLPFINGTGPEIPETCPYFTSTGYSTAQQNNKWWIGNYFAYNLNSDFYSAMEWDFEPPEIEPDDPYAPGGYSGGDDGGEGSYDYDGSPQPFTGLPQGLPDGLNTGFFTLYVPTITQMQQLASYLWSNNFDLDLLKKLFNNPMDLFLNLGIVPASVPVAGTKQVGIGLIQTGISMDYTLNRYVSISMGGVDITPTFKAYLDYSPYVRADLMLPFVGVVPMDIDAIMEKRVDIIYNIDLLSGSCIAGINATNSKGQRHCIGTYAGNAMMPLPLTGSDYSTILSGLIQTAGAIAAGAATGGAAGAVAGGLSASSSAVVNEGKPMIQKGGALSANAGFLIPQKKPVLIFSVPYQCLPQTQLKEIGYPAYRTSGTSSNIKLSQEKGYIKVADIHLKGVHATDPELTEIEALLKEGVYI